MYELWETVKKRYRDQQIKMYQNKIHLQQQLIKRQSEFLEERRIMSETERHQVECFVSLIVFKKLRK